MAYVIYTSGSTGSPKGVSGGAPQRRRRLFANTQPLFGFDASDVWTMFHSCAFDFSVWELWGALLHGGRLVVVDYFTSRSPDSSCDLLRDEQVTVLNQTPTAFYQLAEADRIAGDRPNCRLPRTWSSAARRSTWGSSAAGTRGTTTPPRRW